ncbi:MAG: hypothetical protein LW875_10175 [Proteobacteria bacterium]|jgi:hypothetical protein|nr:hypothetical protein [Pseudomonadota bacterium]
MKSLFVSLILTLASVAMAWDEYRGYSTGVIDLELSSQYFASDANYTKSGGSFERLPAGYSFSVFTTDFGARYSLSERWAAYLKTQVAYSQSQDPTTKRTNSSFTSATFGTDWLMFEKQKWELMPEFYFLTPLEKTNLNENKVLNSEGASEFMGRLVGRLATGPFVHFGFLGYKHRSEGLSGLGLFGVGSEYNHPHFAIGADLTGHTTLYDDAKTDTPADRQPAYNLSGLSRKFNAINPELLETRVWYRADAGGKWGLQIGGGTTITGKTTAAGWNVFGVLNYRFPGPKMFSTPRPKRPTTPDTEKFQEEADDGVDQSLFVLPKPKPPAKAPGKTAPGPSLQEQLDQTEMQIELRSLRKRPRN